MYVELKKKKDTDPPSSRAGIRNRDTDAQYRSVDTIGEGRGGMNREIRFDKNIHITMGKIANRKLLSIRGSSGRCSVMTPVVG